MTHSSFPFTPPAMPSVSLETAIALTGLSRRTIWRRLSEGVLRKADDTDTNDKSGAARTWLEVRDVLTLANIDLDDAHLALLARAEKGDAVAQLELGLYFYKLGKYEATIYWLTLSARLHNADAMQFLGYCHAEGAGVKQADELALMWIAKAASSGHLIAQKQMQALRRNP
jgi:TPR repeat protein